MSKEKKGLGISDDEFNAVLGLEPEDLDTEDTSAPGDDAPKPNEVAPKKGDEAKKNDSPKPSDKKPNKQSIAEVAIKATEDEPDGEDDEDDEEPEPEKPDKKKSSVFKDLMIYKKEAKAARKTAAETKKMVAEMMGAFEALRGELGAKASASAIDKAITDFSEKHGIKPEFLSDLRDLMGAENKNPGKTPAKEVPKNDVEPEDEDEDDDRPTDAQVAAAVSKELDRFIADNPEHDGKINRKSLTKLIIANPEYQDMSIEDVIQDVYGEEPTPGVGGKYKANGGNHPEPVNTDNPDDDSFKKIDEDRKKGGKGAFKEYGDGLIARLGTRSRHSK